MLKYKQKNNLVEKKKLEKQIHEIITCNTEFQDYFLFFQSKHIDRLSKDEIDAFENLNIHLTRMSLFFNRLLALK